MAWSYNKNGQNKGDSIKILKERGIGNEAEQDGKQCF